MASDTVGSGSIRWLAESPHSNDTTVQ